MFKKIKQFIIDNSPAIMALAVIAICAVLVTIGDLLSKADKSKLSAEYAIEMYDLTDTISPEDTLIVSPYLEYKPKKIKYIAVHCTASKEGIFPTQKVWTDFFYKVKYHGKKMGGYNYLVSDKEVFELRPINSNDVLEQDEICWGVANYNSTTVHISYVGGLSKTLKNKDTRTEYQKYAIDSLINMVKTFAPTAKAMGHGNFPKVNKSCPNFKL